MSNTRERIKEIKARKLELSKKQKELRKRLNETKDIRSEVKRKKAMCRADITDIKSSLKKSIADIPVLFSSGSASELHDLADSIMEFASELSSKVRAFAEAETKLENAGI